MLPEEIRYRADGLDMVGQLYRPETGDALRPAILVFPEGPGPSAHVRDKCQRLAGLGYVALGCDLHGDGRSIADTGEMLGALQALAARPDGLLERATAAHSALRAAPGIDAARIAAIGYCFGGTMALDLARSGADIVGVAGFHSGLVSRTGADAANIRGKIFVGLGSEDPAIAATERAQFEAEMRAAGVNWQMNIYGGALHSFTNPEAGKVKRPEFAHMPELARYDPQAAERAWTALMAFLAELFV